MAIIPYKSPKITKLDGRYKLYNRGFRYKISFNTKNNYDPYSQAVKWCENTWGPEYEWTDKVAWTSKRWNDNWRVVITAKNKWWREIYLCREEDVTMMLLVVGG